MLPSGHYVLQRRTDNAPRSPGRLGLFGGGIEAGESPEECIVRELKEETSLEVDKLTIEFIGRYERPAPRGSVYLFRAVIPSADFEVYEGKWAEVHTLEELRTRSDLTVSLQFIVHVLNLS